MATLGGQEAGLPDFGSPWAPNRRHQVNFPWNLKWAVWKVGGIKIFAGSRKKKIFIPKTAIFAPKYAFLGKNRHCRLFGILLVGWLVVVARGLLYPSLLAPSGALIAIPTYYWPTSTSTSTHPLFQITSVLNTGLSLSEPLQLYKGYNAI